MRTDGSSARALLAALFLLLAPSREAAQEAPAPAPAVAPSFLYCPVCGHQNKGTSRFCVRDGSRLPSLSPQRYMRGFVRATETFTTEEIQAAIHQALRSVVRIQAKVKQDLRTPDQDEDEHGYLRIVKDEGRLSGSGFAIDVDGSIVTNAHVAAPDGQTAELNVETSSGEGYPAKLVGVDEASDLAVLRIEAGKVPPLSWADSEKALLGEEAWALGNPLDIGLSMTRGNIASLVRARVGMNQVENFLHSDAFFTHGNSGGPLVNAQGLVLGVNDMGYDAFKSQGYSIPSRMARLVVERIQKDGAYRRGFVGLQVRPVDAESLRKYSLKHTRGLVVESVLKGTPAEGAGFHVGDLLFGINGRGAAEMYLLQEAVSSVGPEAALTFNVERAGAEMTLSVKTATRPASPRIDPVKDLERYLQVEFVEDPKKDRVDVRISNSFSIAGSYHLMDNERVLDVLPAQDWREQSLSPEVFRALSPRPVKSLADLRGALARMYLGGRIGVALNLKAQQQRVVSIVIEENWAVIV